MKRIFSVMVAMAVMVAMPVVIAAPAFAAVKPTVTADRNATKIISSGDVRTEPRDEAFTDLTTRIYPTDPVRPVKFEGGTETINPGSDLPREVNTFTIKRTLPTDPV